MAKASGIPSPALTSAAQRALAEYPFPGNVRELENILERAIALLQGDRIDVADLHLLPLVGDSAIETSVGAALPLQDHLDNLEKQAILEALQKTRFNRTAAARILGVTFRSLRYRMERLGLND
jgi:two-component system response regulator PilR (NtrC family)